MAGCWHLRDDVLDAVAVEVKEARGGVHAQSVTKIQCEEGLTTYKLESTSAAHM